MTSSHMEIAKVKYDFAIVVVSIAIYGVYLAYHEGLFGIFFLVFANVFATLSYIEHYYSTRLEIEEDLVKKTREEYLNACVKGLSLLAKDDPETAVKHFDRALALNPESDKAWVNKGFALLEQEQFEEAVKHFDIALVINSKSSTAKEGKKICREKLKEEKKKGKKGDNKKKEG